MDDKFIFGAPTYAIPHWLVMPDPAVLAVTNDGPGKYGVLKRFQQWMKARFGTVQTMNEALGLNYWSNSVASFEELPDPTGTINGSYACAFAKFQRELAADFLRWQADIVREYKRADQFITQNFDYEWESIVAPGQQGGYSRGIQPDIDHYEAAKTLTLIGTDIYCPSQDELTGMEIAFGGDEMRSLKKDNYLVLETQAQGIVDVLPYPGQLRLMAYSHIASGALGVMYWSWSSIHNGLESYFKGLPGHDFAPNPTYEEAKRVGAELKALGPRLAGLKKRNKIALIAGADQFSAMRGYPTYKELSYNDVVLWMYSALYELNLECDVLSDKEQGWSGYDMLVFPELYSASEEMTERVRAFVENGGVFASFRSFVADEHTKIRHDPLPHGLTDCFGMSYNRITRPKAVSVDGQRAGHWMELPEPGVAETVAAYGHKYRGEYAVVTRNAFGKGYAWYIGTMLPPETLKSYLLRAAADAGVQAPALRYPLVLRSGTNAAGQAVHFLLNYSQDERKLASPRSGTELFSGKHVPAGERVSLPDWGVKILIEDEAGI